MLGRYDRAMRARQVQGGQTLLAPRAIAAIRRNNGALLWIPPNVLGDGAPNLLSAPEDFINAVWVKDPNGVITANTNVAPDDTLTADTLTVTNGQALRQTISKSSVDAAYTGSVWVMRKSGGGDFTIRFVANGSVISGSVVFPTLPLGVWTRVTNTANSGAFADLRFDLTSGVAGTYAIWGAKLELGSTATAYTPQSVLRTRGVFIDSAGFSPVKNIASVIGRMTDRTGGSAVATQNTTANKPTVQTNPQGRYVMRFDGSNDSLATNITTGNEGWICAGVTHTDALGAAARTIAYSGYGAGTGGGVILQRNGAGSLFSFGIGNNTATQIVSATSASHGTPYVASGGWDSSILLVGVNNSESSISKTLNCATVNTLTIGCNAASNFFAGPMTAQVICPVLPSAADRAIIRKWIGSLQGQTL